MSVSLCRRALTVAALASAPLLAQYPALADQSSVTVAQSSVPSIAPGASGRVDLTATNTGPLAVFSTLTFTAPAGTEFADTNLYLDGQQVTSASCALSADAATLDCADDASLVFPANSTTRVGVDLRVPEDAAAAATLGGGTLSVPSVSSAVWSFAVSTSQAAPADAAAPSASGPAASSPAASSPAASSPAASDPAAADAAADPAAGPAATHQVPDDPDQPSVDGGHHCACGSDGSGSGGVSAAGGTTSYVVQMLTNENTRSAPTTNSSILGLLYKDRRYLVTCKVNGQTIGGNPRWYVFAGSHPTQYFSAHWAENVGAIPPYC